MKKKENNKMEQMMKAKEPETQMQASSMPADMIRMAVEGKADLDKLEKLLILQMKWEENEAKKAYVLAMSAFKENPPKVIRDKKNSQYNSMYTTLGNLVNTVNPELSKHGLSASWDIEQNGIIKVTCRMTHKQGYSDTASASAPADTSGAKNAIQQIKSTITYLKAVTFEAITGLASTDANLDDDGNSAGVEIISEKQLSTLFDLIMSTGADEIKFLKYMGIEKLENMPAKLYNKAVNALKSKEKK